MSEVDDHKALYEIWKGMCRRCHDPQRRDYPHYGARGIRVCDEWRGTSDRFDWNYEGFQAFEAWAMAHGFKAGLTIDRINNNAGYSPYNCRFISKRAQAYNRQTNVYYTYQGKTMTAMQWSRQCGIPKYTICKRIKAGWSVERTLTTPSRKVNHS